ncbi:methionyl-tRNA synthetase [Atractiella rhizophila]|nr:methionyl-tRNA synthetase [Atractiella rhizophila]
MIRVYANYITGRAPRLQAQRMASTLASYPHIRSGLERKLVQKGEIVLPEPGKKNTLITSAIPYVNNVPHLGNIIGSVLSADIYARFSRTLNRPTLYICGTDEYGTATEVRAIQDNVTPLELCNKYHALHRQIYEWFELSFDHFGRTTTEEHTMVNQNAIKKLYENNYLYPLKQEQLYCPSCSRFLADRYVTGTCPNTACNYEDARGDQCDKCGRTHSPLELIKPKCTICGSQPETRETENLYLKLGELSGRVADHAREMAGVKLEDEGGVEGEEEKEVEGEEKEAVVGEEGKGVWSIQAKRITKSWLKMGLLDMCVTRDLKWGVPVPMEQWKDKVAYVWFDAPFGYPSITASYTKEWEKWWRNPDEVRLVQFMGKDNVRFHTVLWPAALFGTGEKWTMLDSISVTDYLNYEGTKFSKSRNVGVFGDAVAKTGLPSSVWRYTLISNRPESGDSQFSWSDMVLKSNGELLNNIGNLVNRVMKFANSKFDSVIGPTEDDLEKGVEALTNEMDKELVRDVEKLLGEYQRYMEAFKFRQGLKMFLEISGRANQYLQDNKLDNNLFANQPKRCSQVLLLVFNVIYHLSAVLNPFMPSTEASILRQLNAPPRILSDKFTIDILPGHKLNKAEYLFKKIEEKNIEIWRSQFGGGSQTNPEEEEKKRKKEERKRKKEEKKALAPKEDQVTLVQKNVKENEVEVVA